MFSIFLALVFILSFISFYNFIYLSWFLNLLYLFKYLLSVLFEYSDYERSFEDFYFLKYMKALFLSGLFWLNGLVESSAIWVFLPLTMIRDYDWDLSI